MDYEATATRISSEASDLWDNAAPYVASVAVVAGAVAVTCASAAINVLIGNEVLSWFN